MLLAYLSQRYPSQMATVIEIEKLALDLPEQERAALAANLLESLPGILSDEDEGVAEALRRDAEMEADPNQGYFSGSVGFPHLGPAWLTCGSVPPKLVTCLPDSLISLRKTGKLLCAS